MPIQVDILLIGFDGDGGYSYRVDRNALEELLGSATGAFSRSCVFTQQGQVALDCRCEQQYPGSSIVPNPVHAWHAEDNTICPTVWETGESAAACFSVNYITLDSTRLRGVRCQLAS
jgi:hypothetical protein